MPTSACECWHFWVMIFLSIHSRQCSIYIEYVFFIIIKFTFSCHVLKSPYSLLPKMTALVNGFPFLNKLNGKHSMSFKSSPLLNDVFFDRYSPLAEQFVQQFPGHDLPSMLAKFSLPVSLAEFRNPLEAPAQEVGLLHEFKSELFYSVLASHLLFHLAISMSVLFLGTRYLFNGISKIHLYSRMN